MGLGDTLASGAAEYALVRAYIFLIIAVILAVVFTIISIYIFRKKKVYTQKVNATINTSVCNQVNSASNKSFQWSCNMNLTYSVNGTSYQKDIIKTSNTKYSSGSTIDLYYDSTNPQNSSTSKDSNTLGYILLPIGLGLVFISYLSLYFTKKYRGFATISGGVQAVGDVARIFRYK